MRRGCDSDPKWLGTNMKTSETTWGETTKERESRRSGGERESLWSLDINAVVIMKLVINAVVIMKSGH